MSPARTHISALSFLSQFPSHPLGQNIRESCANPPTVTILELIYSVMQICGNISISSGNPLLDSSHPYPTLKFLLTTHQLLQCFFTSERSRKTYTNVWFDVPARYNSQDENKEFHSYIWKLIESVRARSISLHIHGIGKRNHCLGEISFTS